MRKLLIVLALLNGIAVGAVYQLFGGWSAAASGPTLYLVSPLGQTPTSAQIPIEIWMREADNLAAWEAALTYDASRLRVEEMQLAETFAAPEDNCRREQQRCGLVLGPVIDEESATARALVGAASYGNGAPAVGMVHLATVYFVRHGPGGDVALQLVDPLAADPDANPSVPGVEGLTLALSSEMSQDLYVPSVSR